MTSQIQFSTAIYSQRIAHANSRDKSSAICCPNLCDRKKSTKKSRRKKVTMADRVTQLQDAVNQVKVYFCDQNMLSWQLHCLVDEEVSVGK